jgi:hypothetical protein
LEGQLPYEWTRIQWVGEEARAVWEPRIQRILRMVTTLEYGTVQAGLRQAALFNLSPDEFIDYAIRGASDGLSLIPVSKRTVSMYSSSEAEYKGGPWTYRVIVSNFPNKVLKACKSGDSDELGYFLGYPNCCRKFFRKYWEDERYLDTTWPMSEKFVCGDKLAEVKNVPVQANILLRWAGVRSVFHLPCSFECAKTIELADEYTKLAIKLGLYKETIWLKEMLSWPIEWSALHGIAEIKTPVFRISSRTDLTGDKYTVRYHGLFVPAEGAKGMQFPFIRDPYWRKEHSDWWTSNGFSSKSGMEESHNGIIGATVPFAPSQVYDFGCGNGALLDKIGRIHPEAELFGIEADPKRCNEGRELYSSRIPKRIRFYNTLIRDFMYRDIQERALGIISTERFVESELDEFVKNSKIKNWIVYAYSDNKFFVPKCFFSSKMIVQHKDAFTHLVGVRNDT